MLARLRSRSLDSSGVILPHALLGPDVLCIFVVCHGAPFIQKKYVPKEQLCRKMRLTEGMAHM